MEQGRHCASRQRIAVSMAMRIINLGQDVRHTRDSHHKLRQQEFLRMGSQQCKTSSSDIIIISIIIIIISFVHGIYTYIPETNCVRRE